MSYKGFQSVKLDRPKKSTFDLTHDRRISTRMGRLTPILCMECVPSDYFQGRSDMLVRLAPLLAPIYDQIHVFVHYFFVPNRLLWEEWETFITGGRLGVGIDPENAPIPPHVSIGTVIGSTTLTGVFVKSQLADYLGCPRLPLVDASPEPWDPINLDLMPFAAYDLIWYEYYRDRNFTEDDTIIPLPSGLISAGDATPMMLVKTRNYRHDYFTSALPFTQRGESVLLPIDATVDYFNVSRYIPATGAPTGTTGNISMSDSLEFAGGVLETAAASIGGTRSLRVENIEDINLNGTINDFRSAYALQVWLERNAIGGSRYTESTQAHFGVKPQDSRLQRPEYIGGGRIPVKISEVLSTAWSNDGEATVPLANMAGHGVTYGNSNHFKYFCTEHGFIMGICSIMNPPSYHQGMPRMFRRRSFLDYPWPTFAKLGEQQVDTAELYANVATLTEDENGQLPLFGYQSRYADWKYIPNTNHGDFHDNLLFWTLTREFEDAPVLGEEFNLFDDSTQDRIFAVGGEGNDNFWLYVHNKVTVKRPLPYFGTPNTLGFV